MFVITVKWMWMWKINLILTRQYGIYGIQNMEKNEFQIFRIFRIFGNPYLDPKIPVFDPKIVFWPIFVSFVSFVICLCFTKFDFDAIRKMRNTEYGTKCVSSFAKLQKLEYSVFCRALLFWSPGIWN